MTLIPEPKFSFEKFIPFSRRDGIAHAALPRTEISPHPNA
jgi:hypothetical protein